MEPSHSAGLSPSSLQESINGFRSIIAKTLFAAARPLATSGKWSWAWAVEKAAKKMAKNACSCHTIAISACPYKESITLIQS
jgi:hypothetical protein